MRGIVIMSEEEKKELMKREKRAFIKEQTASNKKNQRRKMGYRILFVLLAAVLFGAVSSFIFVLSTGWLESHVSTGDSDAVQNAAESTGPEPAAVVQETASPSPKPVNQPSNKGEKTVTLRHKDIERISSLMEEYAEEERHSIVTVSMVQTATDWFDNPAISSKSTYGVVLRKKENQIYVLTEASILGSEDKLNITIDGDITVKAKILAFSKNVGLAILQASLKDVDKEARDEIQAAKMGDSSALEIAETVVLFGKSNGYLHSVEWGNITTNSLETSVTDRKYSLYQVNVPQCEDGAGVALNLKGEIVGLLTTDYEKEAGKTETVFIGIRDLKNDIYRLLEGKSLHYLGIKGADMTEQAVEELNAKPGVYVTEVEANSPAYEAGMRNGDVITAIGNKEIISIYELNEALQSDIVDKAVNTTVIRTSGKHTGEMKLEVVCSKMK